MRLSYWICEALPGVLPKIFIVHLMEVDDGGRWNNVGNTYNGNPWSRFTNKVSENLSLSLSLYIYIYIYMYITISIYIYMYITISKRKTGNKSVFSWWCLNCSKYIYRDSLIVYLWKVAKFWATIPGVNRPSSIPNNESENIICIMLRMR